MSFPYPRSPYSCLPYLGSASGHTDNPSDRAEIGTKTAFGGGHHPSGWDASSLTRIRAGSGFAPWIYLSGLNLPSRHRCNAFVVSLSAFPPNLNPNSVPRSEWNRLIQREHHCHLCSPEPDGGSQARGQIYADSRPIITNHGPSSLGVWQSSEKGTPFEAGKICG